MTTIHPQNLPYYQAVLRNLLEGKPHGLQWASDDVSSGWKDVPTDANGMPDINARWGIPLLFQMKPKAPAREMIKIGALELPKFTSNSKTFMACFNGRDYLTESDAETWKMFVHNLQIGDPETIAAITQPQTGRVTESIYSGSEVIVPLADVQHVAKNEYGLTVVTKHTTWDTNTDTYNNSIFIPKSESEEFRSAWCRYRSELEADTLMDLSKHESAITQQREIDRDDLLAVISAAMSSSRVATSLSMTDAIIEHLNAKPVAKEPEELVMPKFGQPTDLYAENIVKTLFRENADLFRERGITIPKELS